KKFRLPIVRRMLSSGIQLGYRLVISIFGSSDSHTVTLVEFNKPTLAEENPPLWPVSPPPLDITAEHATLYDVVQDSHFTSADEDNWERGTINANKNRLFINPRSGMASIKVDIDLQLDLNDPAQPYIGYANVLVTNLDEHAKGAFIVHVAAYEMANTYASYMPEEYRENHQEWITAGDLTLHMVPTYLVVEDAYFEDRAKRLAIITKSIRDALHTVPIITPPWGKPGGDAKWRMRDLADSESHTLAQFEQLMREYPAVLKSSVARYSDPEIVERTPRNR
ncbi:MAG TPA: hypothetical protein VMB83_08660, partial [Roseiarcus sp.]|nr:hypothetical protein [Roseiarcus sp.]